MSCASAAWQSGQSGQTRPRYPRRAVEIVAVILAFFWFWPLAIAYVAWKFMGYPVPAELRRVWDDGIRNLFGDTRFERGGFGAGGFAGFGSSGNAAFDDYRRAEIERLEQERRRLDEEAREFRSFVEELKRAKDREEFDAYMAKRRASGPQVA